MLIFSIYLGLSHPESLFPIGFTCWNFQNTPIISHSALPVSFFQIYPPSLDQAIGKNYEVVYCKDFPVTNSLPFSAQIFVSGSFSQILLVCFPPSYVSQVYSTIGNIFMYFNFQILREKATIPVHHYVTKIKFLSFPQT